MALILKQSFEKGILPEMLNKVQVSPIHKKEDTHTVSIYCATCLLSVFSKIFQKVRYLSIEFIIFFVNKN